MSCLDALHNKADTFARQLGCGGYNSHLAEQDFRGYLESQPDPDYPPWGARASWTIHTSTLNTQSGTGNPLSPLIVVGSEFSADSDNYQELYFKTCFDMLWKQIFDLSGCESVRHRFRQVFLKHWGGAGNSDKTAGYANAPFYKSIRTILKANPNLWEEYNFVFKHMVYHSKGRSPAQQWGKISILLQWLQDWPIYPEKPTKLACKTSPDHPCDGNFDSLTIDDYVFLTESRIEAAAAGKQSQGTNPSLNGFVEHAMKEFRQPRIFLFNPSIKIVGNSTIYKLMLEKYLPAVVTINELNIPSPKTSKPLRLWQHQNGHYIVFSPTNLTGSNASKHLLADIARFIRTAARRL